VKRKLQISDSSIHNVFSLKNTWNTQEENNAAVRFTV